ncbi:MAG: hypothetical protein WCG25_02940 [bacterium]
MALQSLCAITKLKVPTIIYGFAHKFSTLVIVSTAEFVCTVENTRCHVMADSIAISKVSLSRISQTIIISGSCLNQPLSQFAKVNHMSALICAWFNHGILFSTGSS